MARCNALVAALTVAAAASEYQFLITERFSSSDCSTGKTYSDIGTPVGVCHPSNAEYLKVEIIGSEAIHRYYNESDCSGTVLRNETLDTACIQSGATWVSRRVAMHDGFDTVQWADKNCSSTSTQSGDPQALGICAIPTPSMSMMWVCNATRNGVQMNSYASGNCTGSWDVLSFIPATTDLCQEEQCGSTAMSDCFSTTTTSTSASDATTTSVSSSASLPCISQILAVASSSAYLVSIAHGHL
ncbi:unnamed protein product [Symbiodinium natans]|uniref:Uncharacterized protein n=1 Tax=Symbiodinium natans TaxID=878477 RepID=A0A812HDM9_9DINO|nr:unnamed protein product [Symbiodinium natans]